MYLTSHDYIDSPEPRQLTIIKEFITSNKFKCFYVNINPLIPSRILKKSEDIDKISISFINQKQSFNDLEKGRIIPVDILFSEDVPYNGIKHELLKRIGVGILHKTLSEAKKYSP